MGEHEDKAEEQRKIDSNAQSCLRGPFERVLSTVAAPRVPYAWVAQTRPRRACGNPVEQRL